MTSLLKSSKLQKVPKKTNEVQKKTLYSFSKQTQCQHHAYLYPGPRLVDKNFIRDSTDLGN